ncbi:MAG: transposase [Sphingobacteriales bacterium]|jgi:putative transposase|nr:transposase [Sphingobacteriales bacterium]
MEKFAGKYRIESNRLKGWDYAGNGYYFITLVTQNRECILGEIKNGQMILSDFGKIVQSQWLKSFEIRQELFLDEYIIMPNHLHAIVVLQKMDDKNTNDLGNVVVVVEAHGRAPLQQPNPQQPNPQQPKSETQPNPHSPQPPHLIRKPKSISSFMAGFKSGVNSKIDDYIDDNKLVIPKYNRHNHFFQPNYHDHIIRNRDEYLRIKKYIINNPKNWEGDSLTRSENPNKS